MQYLNSLTYSSIGGGSPFAVSRDPVNLRFAVCDFSGGSIKIISETTLAITTSITITNPYSTVFSADGTKLYVVHGSGGQLLSEINMSTLVVTNKVTFTGGVAILRQICISSTHLFIAQILAFDSASSTLNAGVYKVDLTTFVVTKPFSAGFVNGEATYGVAVDASDNVYASISAQNKIYKFNSAGTKIATITAGINNPLGLSYYSGNLYACCLPTGQSGKILKLDSSDVLMETRSGFPVARELAFSYDGKFFVVANSGITKLTKDTLIADVKLSQTITFGSLSNKNVGDAPFALTATASSGLTVTYSSSNLAVATVSGSTVTIIGAGTTSITANQSGNATYNPAPPVIQHLAVIGVTEDINLYLLIGDSNQNGAVFEPVGLDPVYSDVNPRVLIYYKPTRTSTDDGTWENYHTRPNVNRSPGNPRQTAPPYAMGQDLSFAYDLGQNGANKSAIIKVAKGGSTLIGQSGTDNEWRKSANELYTSFVSNFYNVALPRLTALGYNVTVKGIIIRLGTNDVMNFWNQTTFKSALTQFVSDIRADLSLPTLPVYWVQVTSGLPANATDLAQCRAIILNAGTIGHPDYITGFHVINYDSDPVQADNIHFTAPAYLSQGSNESAIMLTL